MKNKSKLLEKYNVIVKSNALMNSFKKLGYEIETIEIKIKTYYKDCSYKNHIKEYFIKKTTLKVKPLNR